MSKQVQQAEERRWRRGVELKPKLRTYRGVKARLEYERYLDINDRWVRKAITRLRGGTNELRVETGRWAGEKLEDRVCRVCGVTEDERHFVVECVAGKLARQELVERCGEQSDMLGGCLGALR